MAANVGVWNWDVRADALTWDATIAELHGIESGGFNGSMAMFLSRIHPADRPAFENAIDAALERGDSFLAEFRVVDHSGVTRWVQGRGAAFLDADGAPSRVVGVGIDTTELRSARERAGRSIELAGDGLAVINTDWSLAYLNPEATRILATRAEDVVGRSIWEVLPDTVHPSFSDRFHRALETQEPVDFEASYGPLDAWFHVRVFPAPDGLTVFFRNIEDRRNADAERAHLVSSLEAALERGNQLQQITASLADTLDVGQVAAVVQRQTRAALNTVFAGVALIDGDALQFQSPTPLPNDIAREWDRVPLALRVPVTDVTRRRVAMFHETRAELLAAYPQLAEVVDVIGNAAFANLPLIAAGRVIGVLAVAWPDERPISPADRGFLGTVANQSAQAIERAQLFDHERTVAATLQRAILPQELPAFSTLSFAGRYLPAEEGLDVGGDWYDVFPVPSGKVALVIGDVAGHGLEAASMMAQLRNMLRAYAYTGASPANVLSRLDDMLFSTGSDQYATCLHTTFDPITRTMTWSNRGITHR